MPNKNKDFNPNLPDQRIHLPLLALMFLPSFEESFENTISHLENLANTIRTFKQSTENMLKSIKEAEQQILSLMGHTSGPPGGNNNYHTLPADRNNT